MVSEVPAEGSSSEVSHRTQRSRSLLFALVVSVLALPLVLVDLMPGSPEDEETTAVIAPLAAYDAVTVTERESTTTTEAPTTTETPTTTAAPTTSTTAKATTTTTAAPTTSTTSKVSADTAPAAPAPTVAAAPPTTAAPVVSPPPATDIGSFLACVRQRESGGYYGAVNPAGYYGAYQFAISTWNNTASYAGRPDLVGVRPDRAAPADQDAMAIALYRWQGAAPWGGYCV